MKLFKATKMSAADIGCLKWSCILFGMVLGAYLSEFTLRYVWVFIVTALILAVKPIITYFKYDDN